MANGDFGDTPLLLWSSEDHFAPSARLDNDDMFLFFWWVRGLERKNESGIYKSEVSVNYTGMDFVELSHLDLPCFLWLGKRS